MIVSKSVITKNEVFLQSLTKGSLRNCSIGISPYKYRILFNNCGYDKPTKISAMPEMGKTVAALNYCAVKQNCLYLPFANMEADFALKTFCNNNPEPFGNSTDWKVFFDNLEFLAKEKHLTVFFDSTSVRNDKSEFYENLCFNWIKSNYQFWLCYHKSASLYAFLQSPSNQNSCQLLFFEL